MDTGKIIDGQFKLLKLIGRGYTSKVYLSEHTKTNLIVALKLYKKKDHTPHEFRMEVESMQKIKHTNVLQIHAANNKGVLVRPGKKDKTCVYIVIEIAENAELFDFISEPEKGFPEKIARFYFIQLINGLKAIHDKGFVHRDLKTENIFLDKNFNLKLGDFGFSKEIESNSKLTTVLGTVGYQSPELLEQKQYSGSKNDIFACGVILFIIVNGYPPFREAKLKDPWYKNIHLGFLQKFWDLHSSKLCLTSPEFIDLINGMLCLEGKRYTIDKILSHDWIKGDLPSEDEFFREMSERKIIVDRSRKKGEDNSINIQVNKVKKAASNKQYRAENEDSTVEVDLFENIDFSGFKIGKSGETTGRFSLVLNDEVISSFKYICNMLKRNYNSSLEILGQTFGVKVELNYVYNEETSGEEITENLIFNVEVFPYGEGKSVAIFNNSHFTNHFTFKNFFKTLSRENNIEEIEN